MPFTGYVYKEIEAESEEEALGKLYDEGLKWDDIEEVDFCEHVTKGNVTYAIRNDLIVTVEEIEEE
jgi:hypothetical protein